ncbi:MAG: hypothetical protein H7301_12510 [Cryobacterium sp.]|nr:hypothetical protein [Oligoflexia bacterium]
MFLLLVFSWVSATDANAAPCCSGSSAIPAMITGDDRAQISASFSHATVIGDAFEGGLPQFRSSDQSETTNFFRLDGARLISDRMQVGAGLSLLSRQFSTPSSHAGKSLPGDLILNFAYEALPEWEYSEWKPRGHVFIATTIPTGRSIYEANEPGLIDSTGKGFFRIAMGAILTKRWDLWDASFITEIHRSLPRTFPPTASDPDPLRVDAGFGGSFALGMGYSPGGGNFRFGIRLQPSFNQPKERTTLTGVTKSSRSQVIDTSLEASYLLSDQGGGTWTGFGNFNDQTLIGPAVSSTLNRTIALGIQHRWDR